jgi:undecaprenyl-phosphate galactose phosphotransferase
MTRPQISEHRVIGLNDAPPAREERRGADIHDARVVHATRGRPGEVPGGHSLADLILARLSSWRYERLLLCTVDAAAMLLAFMVSHAVLLASNGYGQAEFMAYWFPYPTEARFLVFAAMAALAIARFWTAGHYSRRKPFWNELQETLSILLMLAVLDAALVFLGKWPFSRFMWLMTWSLALVTVPMLRILMKRLLIRAHGWKRPTLILGCGDNAASTAAAFESDSLMGFDVVAFAALPNSRHDDVPETIALSGRSVPVLHADSDFVQQLLRLSHLNNLGYLKLVVALESYEFDRYRSMLEALSRHYHDIQVVPHMPGIPVFGMEMTFWFSHDLMLFWVRNNLARLGPRMTKRVFDVVVATGLLIVLSPLFAYLIWRIRRDGGPAFHAHQRIGRHVVPFRCYKFRSMQPNAEAVLQAHLAANPQAQDEWAQHFKLKNDPRVTPLGASLRKSSLDELPQLWNVLKGDMSLVGPRPVVEAELTRYNARVDDYLAVKPGITGLWQTSGRNDIDYERRVFLDAWYIRNWSLWHDAVILLRTVKVVLNRNGAY